MLCVYSARGERDSAFYGYHDVDNDDRCAVVVETLSYNAPSSSPAAIWLVHEEKPSESTSSIDVRSLSLSEIHIPNLIPSTNQTDLYERVFFTFYLGFLSPRAQSGSEACLEVSIDGYRVFVYDNIQHDWIFHTVDLTPWAGRRVDLHLLATVRRHLSQAEEDNPVVLALPRLVQWYGPYADSGGLRVPGRHGGSKITGRPSLAEFKKTDYAATKSCPTIYARWFDFVTQSSLIVGNSEFSCRYQYPQGLHCIAMPNAGSFFALIEFGEVETGQIEIVPNFTRNDPELLIGIMAANTEPS